MSGLFSLPVRSVSLTTDGRGRNSSLDRLRSRICLPGGSIHRFQIRFSRVCCYRSIVVQTVRIFLSCGCRRCFTSSVLLHMCVWRDSYTATASSSVNAASVTASKRDVLFLSYAFIWLSSPDRPRSSLGPSFIRRERGNHAFGK